jgi:hypothetical protein
MSITTFINLTYEYIRKLMTKEHLALTWIGAKSWLRTHLWKLESRGPTPYKIYAFNETAIGNFHDVFSPKRMGLDDVRDLLKWDKYKIEMRYVYRGNKYRVVYRHDDDENFPLPRHMHMVLAPKLIEAHLVRKHDGKEHDVTERVRKYMGPDRDFFKKHGLYVRVQDMFPFDDHVDNVERFDHVRLKLSTGKVLEFDYAENDVMTM